MTRIEAYIDDIITDLNETLSILKNFGAEESKIERVTSFINVLNSRNIPDIIKLIEENPRPFYNTPAAPLLYEINLANDLIFIPLEEKSYRQSIFRYMSLEQFFQNERAKKWLDSLSQEEFNAFVDENISNIEKDSIEYLKIFLKRYSTPEKLLSSLYYEPIKQYVLQNEETATILIENLSNMFISLSGEEYKFLWENYKQAFLNYSIQQRVDFLRKIKDKNPELIPEVLKDLNVIENVSLFGYGFDDFIQYFSDDDKKNIFFTLLQNGKQVDKVLGMLPIESQRELLKDSRFLKADLSDYYISLVYDAIAPELFDEYMDTEIMTEERLLHFYKKTQNEKYLNKLKEQLLSIQKIDFVSEWLWDEDLFALLNNDEINHILGAITYPNSKKELGDFFASFLHISARTVFIDKMIKNSLEFLKLNPGTSVSLYNSAKKMLSEDEFQQIFDSFTLEQQLNSIANHPLFLKFIAQKIKENPTCYNGVEIKNLTSFFSSDVGKTYKEEIKIIFFGLDECNRKYFFVQGILDEIPSLVEPYRQYVLNHLLEQEKILESFFTQEELIEIYKKCSVKVYTNCSYDSILKKNTSFFDSRIDEFIEYANTETFFISNWYKNFSAEGLNKFIMGIKCSKALGLLSNIKDKELRQIIIDRAINEIHSSEFIESSSNYFHNFMTNLSFEETGYFVSKLDNYGLILVLNKINLKVLEQELMKRYISGSLELGMPETITLLSKVLIILSPENRALIENDVDSKLELINQFEGIKKMLKSPVAKLSFIYCVNTGLINQENEKFVMEIFSADPFLFENLDTRLLRNDVLLMGEHFVKKTSRYPAVARKFINIIDSNPQMKDFMILLSQKLLSDGTSLDTYDKKMEIIINYLNKYGIDNIDYNDITPEVLSNIEDYIIQSYCVEVNKNNQNNKYEILGASFECDISNYHQERNKYLDTLIDDMQDINQLRNLFYNRYFWLDYDTIQKFMYSYAANYNDVSEYASSNVPILYIQLIEKIETIEDFKTLVDLYHTMTEEYTISDYMSIVGIMTNAYNKANAQIVNNGLNHNKVTKKFVINGEETEQEVMEATGTYGLFVHSTDAYGSMEMINNDYFESWNYNSNTENHGICCCYITNMSYGTANVKGKGVMFGFNQINEHSIATMAPYDLVTINNGYNITSRRPPLYMRMDKVSSYTRHTHNEFGLERRNDTLEKEHPCIQPNCVVIFEEMSDEIKANTFKAIEDFRKRGIELNIVYIDRVKNLRNEADIINKGIEEYYHNGNIRQLAFIIDRYESNLCGCDFLKDINIHEVLPTEKIKQAIQMTIENIKLNPNIALRKQLAEQLKSVMDNEQVKFDFIQETVGNRAHKFVLYDENIKQQLEEIINSLPSMTKHNTEVNGLAKAV